MVFTNLRGCRLKTKAEIDVIFQSVSLVCKQTWSISKMPVNRDGEYSSTTGLIYLFNLIVGTGALALPGAVGKAGWFLGIVMVCILGLVSYITVTFILETLAIVNAISRRGHSVNSILEEEDENEDTPLVTSSECPDNNHIFEITQKFEIGEMATILLSKPARILVFVCLIVYLLGDLSIYCAVVAKTLAHVFCTYKLDIIHEGINVSDDSICWKGYEFSRLNVYRVFVCVFVICMGPFTFFNLQKTKFLQILTTCMRWIAFIIMISWSVRKMIVNGREGSPPFASFIDLPTLFGACVYSFMCQHSIPGLIQPISNKMRLKNLIAFDYILITMFYLLLAVTAIFAFKKVEALYSLNFWLEVCNKDSSSVLLGLDYYLTLFPVFTLSTSFPIIAITLKNNLKNMFLSSQGTDTSLLITLMFSFVTILVPLALALIVSDLQTLVGVVGSYAGAGVQYLIPCVLVMAARSQAKNFACHNPYISPFGQNIWVYAVCLWMFISLILITVNYLYHPTL